MKNKKMAVAAVVLMASSSVWASTVFSTGFEASEGYAPGSAVSSNANWADTYLGSMFLPPTYTGTQAYVDTTLSSSGSQSLRFNSYYEWAYSRTGFFSVPTEGQLDQQFVIEYDSFIAYAASPSRPPAITFAVNSTGGWAGPWDYAAGIGHGVWDANELSLNGPVVGSYVNGQWNHEKLVLDQISDTVSYYCNGALLYTGSLGADVAMWSNVGIAITTASSPYQGQIAFDNFNIYTAVPEPLSVTTLIIGAIAGLLRRKA